MEGFFSDEELTNLASSGIARCAHCGLWQGCHSPRMKPTGGGRRGILVVAEAPGEKEDLRNTQLVGKPGKLLERELKRFGVSLHDDCRKVNTVNCRPPENRTPKNHEIEACRPMLWNEIRESKPNLIILFGATAIKAYLGHRWKRDLGGVGKWRGFVFPDAENGCWVMATYHPSYLLRSEGNDAVRIVWQRDLQRAVDHLLLPFPPCVDPAKQVKVTRRRAKACHYLLGLLRRKPKLLAADYEATGIKPFADGHSIRTVSFSEGPEHGVAFPLEGEELISLVKRVFADPDIGLIASNYKYEDHWTNVILNTVVRGWVWDTMLASHILDQRSGITSLKFQAMIRCGVLDYESRVAKYLKSKEPGANAMNRIYDAPLKPLLIYNAIDSMLEFRIAIQQMAEMGMSI